MNLKNFKYDYNLMTTLTGTIYDLCLVNRTYPELDFKDSNSFMDLVQKFNDSYIEFQKDLAILPKLDVGEKIELVSYKEYGDEKFLNIAVENPNKEISQDSWTLLMLTKMDGKLFAQTNNCERYPKTKIEEIKLDKELIKMYLSLSSSHKLLLEAYLELKNKFIFGNGTTLLFSKIEGEIFKSLNKFEIVFGNSFFNGEDYIKVVFSLGNNLKVLYDESTADFHYEVNQEKTEIINDLIQNLYIHNSRIPEFYQKEKDIKLVRTK